MSGALKVGDVFVAVSASLNEFNKGVDALLESVEEAADAIEGAMSKAAAALGDFSEGLLSVAAVAGAAVAGAAESSEDAKKATDELKASMLQLSAEVGAVFLPLVHELTQGVRTLTATWRGLGTEQRQQIVDLVRLSAVVGAAGLATSRALLFTKSLFEGTVVLTRGLRSLLSGVGLLASGLNGVGPLLTRVGWGLVYLRQASMGDIFASVTASVRSFAANLRALPGQAVGLGASFRAMLPSIAAVAAPVLVITAAVAALVLLAGSLYRAWNKAGSGMKEMFSSLSEDVRALADKVKDIFVGIFDSFVGFTLELASAFLEVLASKVRTVAAYAEAIARKINKTEWANNLAQVQKLSGEGMVKAVADQVSGVVDAARKKLVSAGETLKAVGQDVGGAIGYGLSESVAGVKDILRDTGLSELPERLSGAIQGLIPKLGDPGTVGAPEDKEALEARYAEWLKRQDGNLRRLLYEDGAAAKKALDAEMAALEETARQVEEEAEREKELVKLQSEAGLEAAQEARRARAAEAEYAVEAWREARDEAQRLEQALEEVREALRSKIAARTGNIQGLVESGAQGAAVAGPMGAVAAVALDLVTQSKAFASIITMVNNTIQLVADLLGALLVPLQPLIGSVLRVGVIVATALTPVLSFVGQVLEPLAPVFIVIGELLQVLQPILTMLTGVLQLIMLPTRLLIDVALRGLFEAVRLLGAGLLWVAEKISGLWNGIVSGVQWVLRGLAHLPFVGAAFEDMAKMLDGVKLDTDALRKSQQALKDLTWDQAKAKAAETAATLRNTEALKDATESLTNVPSAWKIARARFDAQDARDSSPVLPPLTGSAPAVGAQAAAPAVVIDTLNVTASNTAEALREVEEHLDRVAFRNRGTTARPSRYAMGDG